MAQNDPFKRRNSTVVSIIPTSNGIDHKHATAYDIPLDSIHAPDYPGNDYTNGYLNHETKLDGFPENAKIAPPPSSGVFGIYEAKRASLFGFIEKNSQIARRCFWLAVLGGYIGYLSYVLSLDFNRSKSLLWATIVITVLTLYFTAIKPLLERFIQEPLTALVKEWSAYLRPYRTHILMVLGILYVAGVAIFLGFDTRDDPDRLRALAGIALFLTMGVVFSESPGRINWRIIASGTCFQFLFGLVVLRWDGGKEALQWTGNTLQTVLSFANNGSRFVFSPGEDDHNMAFKVMPVLLFASFLIAIMYHLGAMSWFVEKIGWLIYVLFGTTAAESISAAANVFLGMTEAPLTIKPYLPLLTRSEIFAVMAGGFATISGSLMVTFAAMGVNPRYLLAASLMNAPSALVMAKLLYPEVEVSKTTFKNMKREKSAAYNVLDAAMMAASQSVQAIGNILAMLICAIAFLALVDFLLAYLGGLANYQELSLAIVSGYMFYPVAFLMGVDAKECLTVGKLIGYKTFLNEFVAYAELEAILKNTPELLSAKAETIATYALCGFANFSSVGIQIANFSIMAPDRKKDIVSLVLRALLAGFLANLLTASVAGLIVEKS